MALSKLANSGPMRRKWPEPPWRQYTTQNLGCTDMALPKKWLEPANATGATGALGALGLHSGSLKLIPQTKL